MLIRHTFFYILARGLPGLINFAALAIYTRLLTSEEFGRYSIVVAGAGLVHVVFFLWLMLVLGRFVPAHKENPEKVLEPVLAIFLTTTCIFSIFGVIGALVFIGNIWAPLILLSVILVAVQAWHELNLRLATAQLAPGRYGKLSGAKALMALGVGGALAAMNWGASAPIVGLIFGSLGSYWIFRGHAWRGIRPRFPEYKNLRKFSDYGLPLTVTFALVWVTSSSDRLIIAAIVGEHAAGVYSVGYDLAQQSLGLLLSIVNTAALPLAINKLERSGIQAAAGQLKINGELIFVLAFAGAAGLVASGPALMETFVGKEFRQESLQIFPWIAILAAIVGIKSFYFDLAFHLSKQSKWLIVTSLLAAVVNVCLNIVLIPQFGILGAAWSGLGGFVLATVFSAVLGRRVFPMPAFLPMLARAALVGTLTFVATRWANGVQDFSPWIRLMLGVMCGGMVALFSAVLINVAGLRTQLKEKLRSANDD